MADAAPFHHAAATGADWRDCVGAALRALSSLPPSAPGRERLGFLYATTALAPDLGVMLSALREVTGVEPWVGGIGSGVCGTRRESHGGAGLSVMIADLPADHFRLIGTLMREGDWLDEDVMDWVGPVAPVLGILHGDVENPSLGFLVADLADQTDGFVVGGLTAMVDDAAAPLQVAGLPTRGGLSGVLFSGHVPVAVGCTQGCTRIGGYHTVTETHRAAITRLDGRRPLDILCEETGARSRDDLRDLAGVVHVGLAVAGSDVGAYTVRSLVAVDPRTGWIATDSRFVEGDRVCFVRRAQGAAEDDMRTMLRRLKQRLNGARPRGGVYVSCGGRGPELFGGRDREARMIAEELGEFPLTGFFGSGGISHNRLYSHAGVLTVFL